MVLDGDALSLQRDGETFDHLSLPEGDLGQKVRAMYDVWEGGLRGPEAHAALSRFEGVSDFDCDADLLVDVHSGPAGDGQTATHEQVMAVTFKRQ